MSASGRLAAVLLLLLSSCGKSQKEPKERTPPPPELAAKSAIDDAGPHPLLTPAPPVPAAPTGLPDTPSPADNPTSPEKVALGRVLFFDARLSPARTRSCASCHDPAKGWADGLTRNSNEVGRANLRHTQSLYNAGYAARLYWDGRGRSIEEILPGHWEGQLDGRPQAVAEALALIPEYQAHFDRSFGDAPSPEGIVNAIAAYVRTIRSGGAPYDQYETGELTVDQVTAEAVAGYQLFRGKAQCALCHAPPLYTDSLFHQVVTDPGPDPGRQLVTKREGDHGRFRTPGLRGVVESPPYFHDGSAATLRDAIAGCLAAAARETAAPGGVITLSEAEMSQLTGFLRSLTPPPREAPPEVTVPAEPL